MHSELSAVLYVCVHQIRNGISFQGILKISLQVIQTVALEEEKKKTLINDHIQIVFWMMPLLTMKIGSLQHAWGSTKKESGSGLNENPVLGLGET